MKVNLGFSDEQNVGRWNINLESKERIDKLKKVNLGLKLSYKKRTESKMYRWRDWSPLTKNCLMISIVDNFNYYADLKNYKGNVYTS